MENVVYKFYDIHGSLLYIGKTTNFRRRLKEHLTDKLWANEIFCFKLYNCKTSTEMDIYELYYIGKEKPIYNRDCSHEDDIFVGNLEELNFIHYFLIDYLSHINQQVITPLEIFNNRRKDSNIS